MESRRNYRRELEVLIASLKREPHVPKLLLHACCAPCSSYVLEYLSEFFSITLLYYNPNISPREEYVKREEELRRLVSQMSFAHPVTLAPCRYDPETFRQLSQGLEKAPEGGERCKRCYRLRLEEAARMAKELGCDYFTTTLSISPLKRSDVLNSIGEEVAANYDVAHLPSDFKKREGYKRSIELSKKYNLYRQNYCGCVYSRKKVGEDKAEKEGKE